MRRERMKGHGMMLRRRKKCRIAMRMRMMIGIRRKGRMNRMRTYLRSPTNTHLVLLLKMRHRMDRMRRW